MLPLSFVQKVAATIKRHSMAQPRDRILVGVSGGADSVCLVRTLHELGYDIAIAHVNHGLRGAEGDEDEHFVRQLASALGVSFHRTRPDPDELGGNLEAAGRMLRRAFFRDLMKREGFERVAVAHSRDDRNETLLQHLLRGSGIAGLVSMQPASDWLVRPLIEVTRAEIEARLGELGQDWRIDSTNRDLRLTRNRIRHNLLPRLAADFNPRVDQALTRTIEILSAENEWMESETTRWVRKSFSKHGRPADPSAEFAIADTCPTLEIRELRNQPTGLVRRVLRMALTEAGSNLRDISFDHLEQVRGLLEAGRSGRTIELPGPIHVVRSFDTLIFEHTNGGAEDYEYNLVIPGSIEVPEAGWGFRARIVEPRSTAPHASAGRVRVDGESLGPYVKIRNWKNGDTYEPVGLGTSKLKTLFQEKRIPWKARRRWPVLVARTSIVWAASFPVSLDFAPTAQSTSIIEFEAFPVTDGRHAP